MVVYHLDIYSVYMGDNEDLVIYFICTYSGYIFCNSAKYLRFPFNSISSTISLYVAKSILFFGIL